MLPDQRASKERRESLRGGAPDGSSLKGAVVDRARNAVSDAVSSVRSATVAFTVTTSAFLTARGAFTAVVSVSSARRNVRSRVTNPAWRPSTVFFVAKNMLMAARVQLTGGNDHVHDRRSRRSVATLRRAICRHRRSLATLR
jgi:hypothetical protein